MENVDCLLYKRNFVSVLLTGVMLKPEVGLFASCLFCFIHMSLKNVDLKVKARKMVNDAKDLLTLNANEMKGKGSTFEGKAKEILHEGINNIEENIENLKKEN